MSDEAAPQSEKPAQKRMQAISLDRLYLFTGIRLEETLMEVAGAVSGVFLREDPEKVMPSAEVAEAVDQWGIASPELFAGTRDRAAALVKTGTEPLPETQVQVRLDREDAQAALDALRSFAGDNATPYVEVTIDALDAVLADHPLSTQPQFAVHDEVEVSGHHEHVLPPVLEAEGVELPIHGKVVRTSPDDPGFVGVEVELPSPIGTTVVRLHVDQVELEAPR